VLTKDLTSLKIRKGGGKILYKDLKIALNKLYKKEVQTK